MEFASLANSSEFSNQPHAALDGQMPDEFYFGNLPAIRKAAQGLIAIAFASETGNPV